jgi:hypothetical protein
MTMARFRRFCGFACSYELRREHLTGNWRHSKVVTTTGSPYSRVRTRSRTTCPLAATVIRRGCWQHAQLRCQVENHLPSISPEWRCAQRLCAGRCLRWRGRRSLELKDSSEDCVRGVNKRLNEFHSMSDVLPASATSPLHGSSPRRIEEFRTRRLTGFCTSVRALCSAARCFPITDGRNHHDARIRCAAQSAPPPTAFHLRCW